MSAVPRCECGRELPELTPGRAEPVVCAECGRQVRAIPEQIRRMKFTEMLGQGGMGIVYKAHHVDLDRTVAVKILAPSLAADPEFVERFHREARAAAAAKDPNIIQVYEVGHEGEYYYIVMEYVDGLPLSGLLAQGRSLPPDQALTLMEQALHALDVAHRAGILHRDIKPSNMMIDSKGDVKLADFGLAKRSGVEPTLTAAGVIVGTPPYMSPEQARGRPLDARSDLYSMGVVFYQMLTGKLPYVAETPVSFMSAHASSDPIAPARTVNPGVPPPISRWLSRLLSKDPAKRTASAAEALERLRAARAKLKVRLKPPVAPVPRPAWPALAVACALLTLCIATWIFLPEPDKPPPAPEVTPSKPMPPPEEEPRHAAEAREHIREGRWDEADAALARDGDDAHRAVLKEYVEILGLVESEDFIGSAARLRSLFAAVERLNDPEDLLLWLPILSPAYQEASALAEFQSTFDDIKAAWTDEASAPGPGVRHKIEQLRSLQDNPVRRRFLSWLEGRLQGLFEQAERLLDEGRHEDAMSLFTKLRNVVSIDSWSLRADEGIRRTIEAFNRRNSTPLPAEEVVKPLYEIPLDFLPSSFIVTDDGKRAVALHRSAGEVVVISLAERKVERRIGIGNEPTVVAQVGSRLLVGGRTASDLRIIDTTDWTVAGSIAMPSAHVVSIAVARSTTPPRVFISTPKGAIEVCLDTRKIVRVFPLQPQDNVPYPAFLQVTPDGRRLFVQRNRQWAIWATDGAATPIRHVGLDDSATLDAQGQYLVGKRAVYDHFLRAVKERNVHASHVAFHPDLPFAVILARGSFKLLDLYALSVGAAVQYEASGLPLSGCGYLARICPDAKTMLIGAVNTSKDLDLPTTLYAYAVPGEEIGGYFAFSSPPPYAAPPGFALKYPVTVSERFAARTKIVADLLPDGAAWDPSNGTLTWTPRLDQVGKHEVRLKATHEPSGREIVHVVPLDVAPRPLMEGIYGLIGLKLSTDGKVVYGVTDSNPAELAVYDLETDRLTVTPLAFRPTHKGVAQGRFYAIDPSTEQVVSWKLPDASDPRSHPFDGMTAAALVARGLDGEMLAVAKDEEGNKTFLVPVGSKRPGRLLELHGSDAPAISPNGTVMLADSRGMQRLYRWQDNGFKELSEAPRFDSDSRFSHDGRYLSSSGGIYEVKGLRKVREPIGVRFDPTGPYCAIVSDDAVEVLKVGSFERVARIELPDTIFRAVPLSKYERLLILSWEGYLVPCPF